jgi:transposase
MKKRIEGVTVYGIDIGKSSFHVVGLDAAGKPVVRTKFRRDRLLQYFANTVPATIGMESCPGSQWLARKLAMMGHAAKIIPAQFVKPYVKSNKNDMVDAAAIAEAVTRPTMRFVQVRQPEQCARQALHRVRDRYMSQRTGLINQIRGFLLEFGIPLRQGSGVFKIDVPRVLGDEQNELPPSMRSLLADLWNDFKSLEVRIEQITQQIQRSVQYSDTARRLMTVPGIGPLTASALEASAGNGHQFTNGRFFAAWLGLVPRQYSTGGKTTLLGISKRGNAYLRRLLIHGARSCVQTCDRQRHPLGAWITKLEQRMHRNKVIVALANKIARVAWKILTKPEEIYHWSEA